MKKKSFHIIIVFLLVAVGVVGLYYAILNLKFDNREDLTTKKSVVEELIDKDLNTYYPATVNTVMQAYSEYCQALYNEDYTEEQYKKLMAQFRKLMDDELLKNNPIESHLALMKQDIEKYHEEKKTIFNFRFLDDSVNKESEKDGKFYATVSMSFAIKKGNSSVETTEENFILRKDSKDQWKILGWELRKKEDAPNASVTPSASPTQDK